MPVSLFLSLSLSLSLSLCLSYWCGKNCEVTIGCHFLMVSSVILTQYLWMTDRQAKGWNCCHALHSTVYIAVLCVCVIKMLKLFSFNSWAYYNDACVAAVTCVCWMLDTSHIFLCPACYLRLRRRLCFRCGLFVCLSVCPSDYSQTCEWILSKFFGGVGHGSRTKWYNFGGDLDHASDPGVQSPKSGSSGSAEVCSLWVHSCSLVASL